MSTTSFIGPFPTDFVSPPQCTGLTSDSLVGMDFASTCLPDDFNPATTAFYSPGIQCPTGYTAQESCTRSNDDNAQTTITCCPVRNDLTMWCVEDPESLSNVWESLWCTWSAGEHKKVVLVTTEEDGEMVTKAVTMQGGNGVNAYGLKMVYEPSDLTSSTPTSTTESSTESTSSEPPSSGRTSEPGTSTSLPSSTSKAEETEGPDSSDPNAPEAESSAEPTESQGSEAQLAITTGNIVVAVVVPVICISAVIIAFFWYRRRKQRKQSYGNVQMVSNELSNRGLDDGSSVAMNGPPKEQFFVETTPHYRPNELPGQGYVTELPTEDHYYGQYPPHSAAAPTGSSPAYTYSQAPGGDGWTPQGGSDSWSAGHSTSTTPRPQ